MTVARVAHPASRTLRHRIVAIVFFIFPFFEGFNVILELFQLRGWRLGMCDWLRLLGLRLPPPEQRIKDARYDGSQPVHNPAPPATMPLRNAVTTGRNCSDRTMATVLHPVAATSNLALLKASRAF